MKNLYCTGCGRVTGFKRNLGFGTFFAVIITLGVWLLTIPFYPLRCSVCGLKEPDKSKPFIAPTKIRGEIKYKTWHGWVLIIFIILIWTLIVSKEKQNRIAETPNKGPSEERVVREPSWILFYEDRYTICYYDDKSIKKINDNVIEVYTSSTTQDGTVVRQLRINIKETKFAIGEATGWKTGVSEPISQFNFSKAGWVWFSPSNKSEKKIIEIMRNKFK